MKQLTSIPPDFGWFQGDYIWFYRWEVSHLLVHFHVQLCINFKLFYLFFLLFFSQEHGWKIFKTESWQKKKYNMKGYPT